MGKFSGILIVSDLDGTFFSHVPESFRKNLKAVRRFQDEGGIFTIATGREVESLLVVFPEAGETVNAPVIVANGTRLYDFAQKKHIYNCPVKDKRLMAGIIKEVYKKYPDTGVRFTCETNMIVPELNKLIREDLGYVFIEKLHVAEMPLDEFAASDIPLYKCVIVDEPENLAEIQKIGETFDEKHELAFSKSFRRGLEAINKDGTKGHTILRLRDYLGGSRKIFAIGDYDNDIEMIKSADYGAAPASALEHVKRTAKIITAPCENGAIADLIDIIEREYI
jgi:Cof subfamily protein (haloacid dehalogenase superfamily)